MKGRSQYASLQYIPAVTQADIHNNPAKMELRILRKYFFISGSQPCSISDETNKLNQFR